MSPFDLNGQSSYQRWRDAKLNNYPQRVEQITVDVDNIGQLSSAEHQALLDICKKTNMVVYRSSKPLASKNQLNAVCSDFGLNHLDKNLYADDDGISALKVTNEKRKFDYIPYSDKPIRWHTDGYYNKLENSIRAMVLHCENPSISGGDNLLLDHEIVYLLMRDENPQFINALMQEDAMTIPANIEQGVEIRPAQSGPVFSVVPDTGDLHMRYTARTKSIEWKQNEDVLAAVAFLEHLLSSDMPYIYRYRLEANEGVLSNNVLHGRSKIENGPSLEQQRIMYRARYYDRISGTSINSH